MAFLALVAPFLLFPNRWTPLAALLLPLIWISHRLSNGRFSTPTPLDGAMVLFFLTNLVGLYVSVDLSQSLPRFWSILLGLAIFYALVRTLTTRTACRLAGDILLAGGVGLALLTLVGTNWANVRLLQLPEYRYLPTLLRDPGDSNLFNPRVMGIALAVLLPLPLSRALFGETAKRRLLSGFAALVMAGVLLLTQSVQGVLGLSAALLLLAVWHSRWFLLAIPLGLGFCGAAILAYEPQQVAVALLSVEHPLGVGVVLRWDMWSRALAMIHDLPYTGIGLDAFPLIQTGFYPGLLLGPETHAHNLYLQVALDLGLPGLFALLWLLVASARMVARACPQCTDRSSQVLLRGTTAGVVAYLAAGLIDAPWAAKPGAIFWVLLGLAVAVARLADERARSPTRRCRFLPLAGLVALVTLSLVLRPGLGALNLGSIEAHKALANGIADSEGLSRAASHLEGALRRQPGNSQTYRTLGRLYGWLGQYERAMGALDHGVRLDGEDPMTRYAPWVVWLREIQGNGGSDRWEDLIRIYSYWMRRYPKRAESYIQTALVWEKHKGNPPRARAALESGLDNGAEPEGLLNYYLSQLK